MTTSATAAERRRNILRAATSMKVSVACAALVACLTLVPSAGLTGAALAGDHAATTAMQQADNGVTSLFGNRERSSARSGIGRRPLGRAPYVCTPSGFGRTASCQLRGRTNSAFN